MDFKDHWSRHERLDNRDIDPRSMLIVLSLAFTIAFVTWVLS